MTITEKQIYEHSKNWPLSLKRFLVAFGQIFVSFFMIMAWIFHLNFIKTFTFAQALGISVIFVACEYMLNTFLTRYAVSQKVYTQAQLSTYNIVFGVLFLFIVSLFVQALVKEYQDPSNGMTYRKELKKVYKGEFNIVNVIGLFVIAAGAAMVLYD